MPKKPREEILRNILAATFSFAVSLTVAEWAYSQFEPPAQIMRSQNLHPFVDYNPDLGWENTRDAEGIFLVEKTPTKVRNNHEAMRNHEIGSKQGFRIAVQGDSVAWGYGVDNGDRFSDRLEEDLHAEVLNFAVVGYGPVQHYLQLPRVISYQPDLVVLSFTLYNDFADNLYNVNNEFYRPYASLDHGELKIEGQPAPDYRLYTDMKQPYMNQFALGRLLYATLRKHAKPVFNFLYGYSRYLPRREGMDFNPVWISTKPQSPLVKEVAAINKAILRAMRDKLAEKNIPLIILAATTNLDSSPGPLNLLREQCKDLGIPLVTMDAFEKGPKYTFADGIHWLPPGHHIAAEALEPVIRKYMPKP